MDNHQLLVHLRATVGQRHVLTSERATERFRKGFRSGEGDALAVVRPGSLVELWHVLEYIVAADKIVILQAANTGLTEGSTPNGSYDRDVVLINTRRLERIQAIRNGTQVIAFAGATLFQLEKLLAPLGRQPHSVIGSSCIGASIVGGVCNNSGGSLVERGPAYTELSLFAQIDTDGRLRLVNHLGVNLGNTPEEILTRLDQGKVDDTDIETTNLKASKSDYAQRVRDTKSDRPARFNADKDGLYESSGCAGKLAVFAVRLDTFPSNNLEKTYYLGTNDPAVLATLRRNILEDFETLPVSAEYMHRDVFDISEKYGKDTVVMIDKLGTDRLPTFFALKGAIDARLNKLALFPKNLTDKFMQMLAKLWPQVLPSRLKEFRNRYEHHLILKVHGAGVAEAEAFLPGFFDSHEGGFFECGAREAKLAGLNRFAAAGAAIRYQAIHSNEVEDVLALDIALPRNTSDWFEEFPPKLDGKLIHKLYYGHFLCHVLHQDYIVKKGQDPAQIKGEMLALLDQRGAEYPAEHNVGHMYHAKPDLAKHYRSIDPTNSMNPGIGKTSKNKHYA